MAEYHPQLQLYSVAQQSLERLEHDFRNSKLADEFCWTNHFSQGIYRQPLVIDFRDPESSFEADSAMFTGLYSSRVGEFTIGLKLMQDERPYSRPSDYRDFDAGSFCDVVLSSDELPIIVPAGHYEMQDQPFSDVQSLVTRGIGEVIGATRAESLIIALDSLEISNFDKSSLDLLSQL